MTRKQLYRIILGISLLACGTVFSQESVYLKIQSRAFEKIRILAHEFETNRPSDVGGQLRDILTNDLRLSDYFLVLDARAYGIRPAQGQNPIPGINAAAQIFGAFEIDGQNVRLNVRVEDFPDRNLILNKDYSGTLGDLRQIAHAAANEIIFFLVGETGVAGTQISFVKEGGENKELALVDYDGENPHQLTFNQSINLSPTWSPSGAFLAFTSFKAQNPDLIALRLSSGATVKLSTQPGLNTAPAWSPDGKRIAFTMTKDGNAEIYVMDVNGAKLQRLTNHWAIDSSPSWSPSGREIAFTSGRSGSPQVYIMSAEGGGTRRLTYEGGYNASPAWSPQGDLVAYVSREKGLFQVYTIEVNGMNVARVTDGKYNNEDPVWAPDGQHLAFSVKKDGLWKIYICARDGSGLRAVPGTENGIMPAWSPLITE